MANAIATTVVRRLVSSSKSGSAAKIGTRNFNSSGPKGTAGHGHRDGSLYSNDYIHAPHMYNIANMKHKRAKMGFAVFGSFTFAVAVPIVATLYQSSKTG